MCEDIATEEIDLGVITRDREGVEVPLGHRPQARRAPSSPASRSTPPGTRLYFASQRAEGGRGAVYEVSGPFRS